MPDIANLMLYILQGSSGAVAGYLTNKYAVNMLFKEYTPFKIGKKVIIPYKLGGVIKNSKEKFIDELSSLVEKDIINGVTLQDEIRKEEFKKEINDFVSLFINEKAAKAFDDIKLKELSNFDESIKSIEDFIKNSVKENSFDLACNFSDNFKLEDILNNDAVNNISSIVLNEIIKEVDSNDQFNEILKNEDLYLKDILSDKAAKNININIKNKVISYIDELLENNDKLKDVLNNVYDSINIEEVIRKLESSIKDRNLYEFITEEDCKMISAALGNNIDNYINEEKPLFFKDCTNLIINVLKDLDFTIYDILPEEIGNKLSNVIVDLIPKLVPYLSDWINVNKNEFDALIEQSIDEALEGMDNSIKSLIISKVRSLFLNDISAKNKVVEKVIDYIKNYEFTQESFDELSNKIISFLKNTKIKDIVLFLENKNLLNDNIINKISDALSKLFSKYKNIIIENFIKANLNKNLENFIKADFVELFNVKIRDKILSMVISNKENIRDFLAPLIQKNLSNALNNVLNTKISNIAEKNNINIKDYILSAIDNNKDIILNKIYLELYNYINNFNLKDEIINNKKELEELFEEYILNYEKSLISKFKDYYVSNLIFDIPNKENITKYTQKEVYNYLESNLNPLLKNRVKRVIYNNLIKFDEDEICDLAQRFMGNELKPLSIFGGLLGLIAGLTFGGFVTNVNLTGFYGSIGSTISSMLIMGIIGAATNIIAIGMLFKPYNRNKFLAKIPFFKNFSLGYIPAHKDNLSRGIGNVIDNDLLNHDNVKSVIAASRSTLENNLVKTIEKDNFKVIRNLISSKKENISLGLYKFLLNSINKNKDNIYNKIKNVKVKSLIKNIDIDSLAENLNSKMNSLENVLNCKIQDILNSKKTLNSFVSDKYIEDKISEFIKENSSKYICDENIKKLILECSSMYYDFTSKSLLNLIGEEISEKIKKNACAKIDNFIFNDLQSVLQDKIKDFFAKEIDGDKTIKECFNGNISSFIDNNMTQLGTFLINKASDLLKNNEDNISMIVKNKVNESLGFFEKIGYAMAGGDAIVERCVNVLIENKLPNFMNYKFYEISGMIKCGLNNTIYPMKISDLKIKSSEVNSEVIIDNVFSMLCKNDNLRNEVNLASATAINLVLNSSLNFILTLINLDSTEKLYERFSSEINIVKNEILANINDNNKLSSSLLNVISNEVLAIKISEITKGIDKEDIKYSSKTILNIISNSDSIQSLFKVTCYNIYNLFKEKNMDEILSKEHFDYIVENIKENTSFNNANIIIVNNIINKVIENEFNIISYDTKNDITNRIVYGFLDTTLSSTSRILKTVDLKKVTCVQIDLMKSEEIHNLFKSFAGEYFKKLYMYGFYGAIFGINVWLPIIWFPIDMIMDNHKEEEILEHN